LTAKNVRYLEGESCLFLSSPFFFFSPFLAAILFWQEIRIKIRPTRSSPSLPPPFFPLSPTPPLSLSRGSCPKSGVRVHQYRRAFSPPFPFSPSLLPLPSSIRNAIRWEDRRSAADRDFLYLFPLFLFFTSSTLNANHSRKVVDLLSSSPFPILSPFLSAGSVG